MADATLDWQTFSLNGNYEVLGSDAGVFAFQTPLATLHKFQGWADLFLTTPSAGVRDLNFTLTKKFPAIPVLQALSAPIAYHRSEERRVGKECVSKCKSRCARYHEKKN